MQKKLLLVGAACLFASGAAAADLPVEPAYVAPLFDWTGFYVGVNAGYGGGTFKHPFNVDGPCYYWYGTEAMSNSSSSDGYCYSDSSYDDYYDSETWFDGSADITAGGFVGGVQAGYNWAWGESFLIGIEGDIQGSTIDGRVSADITDDIGVLDYASISADIGTSLDWFATIRPRIGWANDRFLVYATGGLAWGQTTSSLSADISGYTGYMPLGVVSDGGDGYNLIDESVTNDRFGWSVGFGLEYALTENMTFKTEYLFTDLGTEDIFDTDLGNYGYGDFNLSASSDVAFHTVRAGFNFMF